MSTNAERQAKHRKRHPERHTLALKIQTARQVAALRVASRHWQEWENEILKECRARNIPRFLPPLPEHLDARKVRH